MRVERLPQSRDRVERALPAEITGQRRAEIVDLVIAVTSSSMFLELVDRMGHDPSRRPTSSPICSSDHRNRDRPGGRRTEGIDDDRPRARS